MIEQTDNYCTQPYCQGEVSGSQYIPFNTAKLDCNTAFEDIEKQTVHHVNF